MLTNTVSTVILPPVKTIDAVDGITFSLSPNPAGAFIQLNMTVEDRARVDAVEIMDVFGRKLIFNRSQQGNVLDLAGLTQGMYSVVLRGSSGSVIGSKQFVRVVD